MGAGMKTRSEPETIKGFQVEDPREVFAAYSREEMERQRETNPDFDGDLHREAVELVLSRLWVDTVPTLEEINREGGP